MKHETEIQAPPNIVLNASPGDAVLVIQIPGATLGRDTVLGLLAGMDEQARASLHVCHGAELPETYAYAAWMAGKGAEDVAQAVAARYPGAQAFVMQVTQAVEGASAGRAAHWHYVVETDVAAAAEDDFNAWYSQEHLPGLAAVPGSVRALRLTSPELSPSYHALYLLEDRATFGSPPWLAVRATAWSSRVRPNFRNTKRTMFTLENP